MDFNTNIKNIKKLTQLLTGKDVDVFITYKGTALGVTKPWNIRCGERDLNSATHESAAVELVNLLREEMATKISFTKKQAAEYEKALGAILN